MSIKNFMIEVDEIRGFEFTHRIAGAIGLRENKSLDIVINEGKIPTYRVEDCGNVILETDDIEQAVICFNDPTGYRA